MLFEELKDRKGLEVTLDNKPNPEADINHHINYAPYKPVEGKSKHSLMVTHIWEGEKLDKLTEAMKTADMGICMSSSMPKWLMEHGVPSEKLDYVLPAHDGVRRRFQVVAILTNVYPDGCKREGMFTELVKILDKNLWAFRIMGSGWHEILAPLVADGLQVDYFADFDQKLHQQILDSSDYALYLGEDEGSMGLLDAKNAGIPVISTPQGFHLDMGLDYSFSTQDELNAIFKKLTKKVVKNPVKKWTWKSYADQHLKIWKKLLK